VRAVPRLPDDEVNVSQRRPLREALVLIVGISLVATAVFSLLAWSAELFAPLVPIEVEAELLETVLLAVSWAENGGDDDSSRQLTQLVERLARHWPEDPYEHRVLVTDERIKNAYAMPGGMILVTRGLLDAMESENEIAFVLGHELGHFRNRDHLVALGRSVLFRLVLSGMGLADVSTSGLIETSGKLIGSAYSREQESEADRFALELLQAEYGHVGGATAFLERLTAGALRELFSGFAGTHPSSAERVSDVLRYAREHGQPLDGELITWDTEDTR
jgi:Zn-dependent protease with chaperone function